MNLKIACLLGGKPARLCRFPKKELVIIDGLPLIMSNTGIATLVFYEIGLQMPMVVVDDSQLSMLKKGLDL